MQSKIDALREGLIKEHWRFNYSWRGVTLEYLERRYEVSAAEILSVMRDIAKTYDPPNTKKLPKTRCKSCGMQIFWGQLNGESHPYDPKILTGGEVETGRLVRIRESHFVSCPNAKSHRRKG